MIPRVPPGPSPAPSLPEPRRPSPLETVEAEALALRAWALHVLAGAAPPGRIAARAAGCSPAGWDRFLRVERCGLPLHAAASALLPPRGREVLDLHRTAELKRVLSARAQLLWLGRAARARGWPLAVLKGGAHVAAGGDPLDLADVDVLAPAEVVGPVTGLLDGSGYDALGRDAAVGAAGGWHLAQRRSEGSIQVEVHYTVRDLEPIDEVLARSVPLTPGLLRLAPADELWHLLVHVVSHHPERRGNLREMLLLGRSLARAGPDEQRAVEARAAEHPHSAAMRAVVRMARGLAGGTVPPDEFRVVAAAAYSAAGTIAPLGSRVLAVDLWQALFASLAGEGKGVWKQIGAPAPLDSAYPAIAFLERRVPPVGRGARMLQRGLRLGLAHALSRRLLRKARRLCREAERMERE